MYTRVKIKQVPAEKNSPSYTASGSPRKITQTKSLYRSEYPEHTKIITEASQVVAQAARLGGIPDACDSRFVPDAGVAAAETQEEHVSSFGRVICTIFSAFLGAVLIYLSGVSAPEYVDSFFMAAYNTVTEKYTEVFAAENLQPQPSRDAAGGEAVDAIFRNDTPDEPEKDTEAVFTDDFQRYAENSYIASIAGEAKAETPEQTLSASVSGEEQPRAADAVTVSRNLSPGSDKIYIMNETHLAPDLDSLAAAQYPIYVKAEEESLPRVLIVHTHGTEAYSDSTPDGTTRTADKDKNVVRVGAELAELLNLYGIPTLHSETMHDEISYITSYSSSKKEVQKLLALHPSIKYVIDVHRDAIPDDGENRVKPVARIGGESTAQLMLVVGTNAGGGDHPGYVQNLTVAAHLQKKMNETYPGLARPINVRNAIFNQNVCSGAFLLEVGSDGNTLEEALAAVRLFARCFAATEFQRS